TFKGELTCEQCGAPKILEVRLQDNHSRIFYCICSLVFMGESPEIWMNPRLDEKCSSCEPGYMTPKPETRDKNNWVFLYLIEALGCLSLDDLRRYCRENELYDMEEKERVLFTLF
ncbi:hypothetical protein CFOL_v3_18061, partial [Cephalotus follicularis]